MVVSPGPKTCQTPTRRRRLTHSLRVTTTARPMVSPKYSTAPPWSSPYRVLTSGAPTRPYWRTGRVCGPDRAIGLPAGSRPGHMGYRPGLMPGGRVQLSCTPTHPQKKFQPQENSKQHEKHTRTPTRTELHWFRHGRTKTAIGQWQQSVFKH